LETESKNRLTKFLTESWKKEERGKILGAVTLITSVAGNCFAITKDAVREVSELMCSHKEEDTRLVLHARLAPCRLGHVIDSRRYGRVCDSSSLQHSDRWILTLKTRKKQNQNHSYFQIGNYHF
jgi:hypothetical protein